MTFERVHRSKSQSPQSSSSTSQFAPRPFPVQKPKHPPTQEEIDNEAFHQNKFEAFGLQLKEKHGTITPVEQERLGVLQAKMDSFWAQRMERAKAQPNLLEILIRNSQTTQTTESQAPVQSNTIQAKSDTTGDRPDSFVQQRPNKTGMPDALKAGVENLSGYSLDDVRVHYNSPKPAQLQAFAYTQGTEIHVAPGEEQHLPHEAWHVVQQVQGRVKPTMQMKDGVPVNDDQGLEHEADVMGAQAVVVGQLANPSRPFPCCAKQFEAHSQQESISSRGEKGPLNFPSSASGTTSSSLQQAEFSPASEVIQGNFKVLDGERITILIDSALRRGENLDADFLEGLFVRGEDFERKTDNPDLFIRVGKVPKHFVTGNSLDASANIQLFALANSVEDAERIEQAEAGDPDARNTMQILDANVRLYDLQERGPIPLAQVQANVTKALGGDMDEGAQEHGRAAKERLIGNILEGGDYEGDTDSYGNIAFRFKKLPGCMYVDKAHADNAKINQLLAANPEVKHVAVPKVVLTFWQEVYQDSKFPHPEERIGNAFLFVADDLKESFSGAVCLRGASNETLNVEAAMDVRNESVRDDLPPAPPAANKNKTKDYTSRALRGSRNAGQAAVMNRWSAGEYAKHFNPKAAEKNWEWLHVQGARLGGPNVPTNLVAGTDQANSAMIPYERAVYRLSKVATVANPVRVQWNVSLKQDETGANTHIGDKISMTVSFPNGVPDAKDGIDPQQTASPFPATINALEGAPVTKFDRDITDLRTGKDIQ